MQRCQGPIYKSDLRNAMEKLTEINEKRRYPPHFSFLIRLRFQGYNCKSDIAIFL